MISGKLKQAQGMQRLFKASWSWAEL